MPQHVDDSYWDELRDERIAAEGERLLREGLVSSLPTDATFVRYITLDEFPAVHAECVRRQGFDAAETADGGVSYEAVPVEQSHALHEAVYRCEVMYPVHPRYLERLTDEQLETLYGYFVGTLVPCLEAEGYQVGPPPSLETFKAGYYTETSWHPYNLVEVRSESERLRLHERCPPRPPLDQLYG